MCRRYTLKTKPETLAGHFGLDKVPALESRYNIAPTRPLGLKPIASASGPE